MGYLFTLLYLVTAYITPPVLFGPLTEFHIEIVLVIAAIVASLPHLSGSGLLRAPQTLALAGIAFAMFASVAQSGWLGGTIGPLYNFLQPALAFCLVAVNCKRKWHFSGIVIAFFLSSAFFMYMGLHDLQANVVPSEYLYGDGTLRRLRGLGFVHDPNDLSQVMVSLVPCVFLWRRRAFVLDILLLGVPIAVLLCGMYYTHSRGAMLAMTAVVLFSARRKIGLLPASILAALLVVSLFSIGWSGGRDISMDSGADRLDLWYDGIQSFKAHPLFGIGLGNFTDTYGITAHNSVVICVAELGVVGLFFWILLIVSSMRTAISCAGLASQLPVVAPWDHGTRVAAEVKDSAEGQGEDSAAWRQTDGYTNEARTIPVGLEPDSSPESIKMREGRQILKLMPLALVGMLTAGWFLSRTFSMFLFMYFGMVYAAQKMTDPFSDAPKDKLASLLKWSAVATAGVILVLYVIMRARNILSH